MAFLDTFWVFISSSWYSCGLVKVAELRCWWHDSVVKGGVCCSALSRVSDGPPKAGFCRWHKTTGGPVAKMGGRQERGERGRKAKEVDLSSREKGN